MTWHDLPTKSTPAFLDYQPAEQNALQEALHQAHQAARQKILEALGPSYYKSHRRQAAAIEQCGNAARVYIDPDHGQVRPWLRRCKNRLCPFCAKGRQAKVAHQMNNLIAPMKHPRQIILTVKSKDRPLASQLTHLRHSFAKLRRIKPWKDRVAGGFYVVETTLNEDTSLWHPHLHIIYDGQYMPWKLLQNHWHRITNDSEIVWVQDVTDRHAIIGELTKYLGKPQRVHTWPPMKIREYASAISGSQMYKAFGSLHGRKLDDTDKQQDLSPNIYSVSIPHLVHLANQGHDTAQRLVALIAQRWPTFASYIFHAAPQLEPPELKQRRAAAARARITGHPRAPPPPKRPADKDAELDARLFVQFTRFRQEGDEPIATAAATYRARH